LNEKDYTIFLKELGKFSSGNASKELVEEIENI